MDNLELFALVKAGQGGGGTEVIANPTLAGTEPDLTGLQVGDDKYKVPDPGTTVVANPTLAGTESDLVGLQVGDIKYKISAGGGDTSAPKLVAPLYELMGRAATIQPGMDCIIFDRLYSPTDAMNFWGYVPSEYREQIQDYTMDSPLSLTVVCCPTIEAFNYINRDQAILYNDITIGDIEAETGIGSTHSFQILFYWDDAEQKVDGYIPSSGAECSPFDMCTMTLFVSIDPEGGSGGTPTLKADCSRMFLDLQGCTQLLSQFQLP